LVLAPGSVTNYFGIKGLEEYSYGVKSIHQALELKRHMHDTLVAGHEERNYVIIGAGATGVELAGELAAYLKEIRRNHQLDRKFEIHLVEAADKILPILPASFTKRLEKRLKRLGIKLHLKTPIVAETHEGIELPGGRSIKSQTVVWTAGMTINPLMSGNADLALSDRHKVLVNEYLQAAHDVYVIGDSADTQYSGMAQTALHDANYVAEHLKRYLRGRKLKSYRPERPVYAIPVGRHWSGVLWGKAKIYGYRGWMLRRLADLRLYLRFLPLSKAVTLWRYGITVEEDCNICRSA
jgi:NADH dehydrogenase